MTCGDPSCDSPVKARGLCSKHYQRALKSGEIVPHKKNYLDAEVKTCPRCKRTLPLSEFHIRVRRHRGDKQYACYCDLCHAEKQREWRAANPEANDRYNAKRRLNRKEDPDKHMDADLRSMFNITLVQYRSMLASQGGVCAICGKPDNGTRLSVDHDHACCPGAKSCGKCVRSLLCRRCNTGLGAFNDSLTLMSQAVDYLTKWGIS